MHKLTEIIKQPEGRKLKFKETLPTNADLAKTIVAFANDAGSFYTLTDYTKVFSLSIQVSLSFFFG